jgi:flagellar basal-body rod protein FlgB
MSINPVPIMQQLKDRMQWLQARQKVLSENVANADMPDFKPRDLRESGADSVLPVSVDTTNPAHMAGSLGSSVAGSRDARRFETRPSGNAVVLEDEMMKVADTQMDYQLAATLYSKSLGLLKMAVGKR